MVPLEAIQEEEVEALKTEGVRAIGEIIMEGEQALIRMINTLSITLTMDSIRDTIGSHELQGLGGALGLQVTQEGTGSKTLVIDIARGGMI